MDDVYSGFLLQISNKDQLISEHKYIMTRGNSVYLRILVENGCLCIMTATAGENNNKFLALDKQQELMEAACKTAEDLGQQPKLHQDQYGRSYVKICTFNDNDDLARIMAIFEKFMPATA